MKRRSFFGLIAAALLPWKPARPVVVARPVINLDGLERYQRFMLSDLEKIRRRRANGERKSATVSPDVTPPGAQR